MEISFTDLKEKEIINVFDGKKLGRIVDILFDNSSGVVRGIVVPGERKIFRKSEDVFVPLERLRKIGGDVILVNLKLDYVDGISQVSNSYGGNFRQEKDRLKMRNVMLNYGVEDRNFGGDNYKNQGYFERSERGNLAKMVGAQNNTKLQSFVRYKRIDNKKYK